MAHREFPKTEPPRPWRFALAGLRRWRFGVAAGAAALVLGLAEGDLRSLPFTLGVASAIWLVFFAISMRPRWSTLAVIGLFGLVAGVSMTKYKFMAVNANVLDLTFYFDRSGALDYLLDDFAMQLALFAAALAALVAALAFAWRREPRRPMNAGAPVVFGLGGAMLLALGPPKGSDDMGYYVAKKHFVSAAFASLGDLRRASTPDPVETRIAQVKDASPFAMASACAEAARKPDIFLVLGESAVVPSRIPGWRADPEFTAQYRSADGQIHATRAETHGGGTWITETSILSGLSMADFGWMRPYATTFLRGRLKHGLPAFLKACGYRTVVFSPTGYNFVGTGPMWKSLGVDEHIDQVAMGAPSKHEMDSFYFGKILDFYRRHIAEDGRPLFVFAETMGSHAPYSTTLAPGRSPKFAAKGDSDLSDEYLRRESFAREDFNDFVAAVETARGARPALAATFGDHHPEPTLASYEAAGLQEPLADWRSPAYETFYLMRPMGLAPPPLPQVPALDFAYLGVTLLEQAGLPLDAAFAAASGLRDHCGGAFHTCADRAAVDLYLARLRRSGLLGSPPAAAAVAAR
ncbi:MAG TPA: sulfatase-like hydrolase/transferase [Rhodoblastus sp.]|nr:sulfatase-like hydrolase/transferase [Rhodoblastus sp.]